MGQLDIFGDALTVTREGVEAVICGCCIMLSYFKSLGRKYRNDHCGGSGAAALLRPDKTMTTGVGYSIAFGIGRGFKRH